MIGFFHVLLGLIIVVKTFALFEAPPIMLSKPSVLGKRSKTSKSKASKRKKHGPDYQVGDRVSVRWSNKTLSDEGKILMVKHNHAAVEFDDGDCELIPFHRLVRVTRAAETWGVLPAGGNMKNMINDYLMTLVKPGDHVFTLEDPSKWRTTRRLLAQGARVTALSIDPGILDPPDPSVTVVHDYTTPYLRTVSGNRPALCWLDYCASVRRSNSGFDWVEDLSLALVWTDGPVVLTFSKRGVSNYMSFALNQIGTLPNAQVADVFEYQGENKAAMCAFTVVRTGRTVQTLTHFAQPQPGQTVRVKQAKETWEGTLVRAYTPLEMEVMEKNSDRTWMVYSHEITHVKE